MSFVVVLWGCGNNKSDSDNTEPIDSTEAQVMDDEMPATGSFGMKITDEGAISLADMMSKLSTTDSFQTKIIGQVSEVCQAKGCWMTMDVANEVSMRIRFKDYGFFVPKNCAGKEAVLQGQVKKSIISVEELRHYAEDAGKTAEEIAAITEPEDEISFLADGVIIR